MKFTNPFLTLKNFMRDSGPVRPAASPVSAAARPVHFLPRPSLDSAAMPLDDRTVLLRPLNDEHLLEVYREAKSMQLSDEFIRLIEDAIRERNLEDMTHPLEA